jgi:predicted AlkP superfamily phosphohydrolase/phosphomutase
MSPNQVFKALKALRMEKFILSKPRVDVAKTLNTKFLSFDDVDWDRTKAFSRGFLGQIHITGKGDEYFKVRQQVIDALLEIRDQKTGEKIVTKIVKKEEAYSGKFIDDAPDLVVIMQDFRYNPYPFFASSNSFLTPHIEGTSGTHKQYGIFCAAGSNIKPNQELQGLRIIDVCPTILHILGIQVPEDMDGRVIKELFREDSEISRREVKYQEVAVEPKLKNIIENLKLSGKI